MPRPALLRPAGGPTPLRLLVVLVLAVAGLSLPAPAQAIGDRDCSDFDTQRAAQRFFLDHGGPRQDPHGLDADGDGIACESNPCPCSNDRTPDDDGGGGAPRPPRVVDTTAGLSLSRPAAIAGERVTMKASVKPAMERRVVLQRKDGRRWFDVDTARTNGRGIHAFRPRTRTADTTYRVLAPRVETRRKVWTADTSPSRELETQRQLVVLTVPETFEPVGAFPARARAYPTRVGRPIVLQEQQDDGSWLVLDRGLQNDRGRVSFDVVLDQADGERDFRAVVRPAAGAAAATSDVETTVVEDVVAPGAVSGFAATAGDGVVTVTWEPPADDDVVTYELRRCIDQEGACPGVEVVGTPGTTTVTYVDDQVANGTTYTYTVFALDEAGNAGPVSSPVTATPSAPVSP